MIVPSARGSGAVQQSGGTNTAVALDIGNGSRFGGWGSYVLSNGVVTVNSSTTLHALGTFEQWNGLHTIASNLVMSGSDLGSLGGIANASYLLRGGTLSAMTLSMGIATLLQQGGSNRITRDIVIAPPTVSSLYTNPYTSLYTLNGGFLSASNVILNDSFYSGFNQTGGTHVISSELQIVGQGQGFHGYILSGGSLSVNNIFITNGSAFYHNGGVIHHSNLLTLAEGTGNRGPEPRRSAECA